MHLERIISLLGVAIGETLAGFLLYALLPYIKKYPHILALYPILAAARGNIYSSLASRIASRLHLGIMESRERLYTLETRRVLALSLTSSIYSATMACIAVHLGLSGVHSVNPLEVYATAMITPLFMAPFMTLLAIRLAELGYSRGLDPDEYLSPILTVTTDVLMLPVVTLSAIIAANAPYTIIAPLAALVLLYSRLGGRDRRVVWENLASIIAGSSLEFIRSYALVASLDFLEEHPLVLSLLPVFNAENGAVIAVIASKLSTMLHLGLKPPSVVSESLAAIATLQPPYLISSTLLSIATGSPSKAINGYALVATAGLILLPFLVLASRLLGYWLYSRGLDPDNTLLPLSTTLTDIAGTLTLLALGSMLCNMLSC